MRNGLKKNIQADFGFGIRLIQIGLPQLMQHTF